MSQFHEGQDVEVLACLTDSKFERPGWRKAKIVRGPALTAGEFYEVQFPDGTRRVEDAAHIRAIDHRAKMLEPLPGRSAGKIMDKIFDAQEGKPEFDRSQPDDDTGESMRYREPSWWTR